MVYSQSSLSLAILTICVQLHHFVTISILKLIVYGRKCLFLSAQLSEHVKLYTQIPENTNSSCEYQYVNVPLKGSAHLCIVRVRNANKIQENVVRLLLDAGGNIDAQSVNGGTPLMRAIETSQRDMIKLLLERG